MIPVTDAYPALLRLTLRCLTCHGGVGVLLGCYFFPFFFPSFLSWRDLLSLHGSFFYHLQVNRGFFILMKMPKLNVHALYSKP